jgi:hypothetical protein
MTKRCTHLKCDKCDEDHRIVVSNVPSDYSDEKLIAQAFALAVTQDARVLYLSALPVEDEAFERAERYMPDEAEFEVVAKQYIGNPLKPPARLIAKDCKQHKIDLIFHAVGLAVSNR